MLSTGLLSPTNALGFEPITFVYSFWVTRYSPAQKSPGIASRIMSTLFVKTFPGASGAFGSSGSAGFSTIGFFAAAGLVSGAARDVATMAERVTAARAVQKANVDFMAKI